MTLFFPDLNVWLALSVASHSHCPKAWRWLDLLPDDARLIFSRYTQIGLLRLLTNRAAMGQQTLTLRQAWGAYDRWLKDPRVEFYPETPRSRCCVPPGSGSVRNAAGDQVGWRLLLAGIFAGKRSFSGHLRRRAIEVCPQTRLRRYSAGVSDQSN
jgi:hypothetical protein